jgi:hypothetical protein
MSKLDSTLTAAAEIAATPAPAPATPASPANRPDTLILMITLFGIVLWGLSVAAFGIPGLYIPALIAVPVIWVLLILITRG